MNRKKLIRKLVLLAIWLLVLGGMTTLLVAANRKQKEHVCSQVLIGIKGTGGQVYIEKEEILELMQKTSGRLIDKTINSIDLRKLEKALEQHSWIRDAELYFDSKQALHVYVEERTPIARVFATNGTSFYIDSSGHKMSLVDNASIRLPVITGFVDVKRMTAKDSAFLDQVKQVAVFVFSHGFWNAQIGQIDITPEKNFELVPVIGDHVIRLGKGENVEEKLNRLYVFYKQVLGKVGFTKYAALDLRFDRQVVAVNKEPVSPVDSIQLQKNIEELMNRASLQEIDENMLPDQTNYTSNRNDSNISSMTATNNQVSTKTDPDPIRVDQSNSNPAKKSTQPSKPLEKPKQEYEKREERKPKAVMRAPL